MKNEKRLPRVGDIVEMLGDYERNKYRFIIGNPHERYYKVECLKTGERFGWNIGWSKDAETNWEHTWKIR